MLQFSVIDSGIVKITKESAFSFDQPVCYGMRQGFETMVAASAKLYLHTRQLCNICDILLDKINKLDLNRHTLKIIHIF